MTSTLLSLALLLPAAHAWSCIPISSKSLHDGVEWRKQNCTKGDPAVDPPLLTINSIHIDLTRDDLRVVPAIANPEKQVQNLPDMGKENPKFIAGINGGYFWRVDIDGFWNDNVCRGKTRSEAETAASSLNPNFGIGDGVIKVDGQVLASNCDCPGYSRPAVLNLGTNSSSSSSASSASWASISVLSRGEQPPSDVQNAIGAGPNLVSFDPTTGRGFVDIPADDDNINRLVYEATTAVGVDFNKETLIMVTTDGSDSCLPNESFCGLFSPDLATLMLEVFECSQAMSMDQGGSTTMWIDGENPERSGVVSRSDNKQPEETEGARALANGLFIELL